VNNFDSLVRIYESLVQRRQIGLTIIKKETGK